MYEKEQFVQSVILLAVLTAISFSRSAAPYLLLLVCSGFMLFFTLRSLQEPPSRYAVPAQLLLSAAYIAISGHAAAYLIFYEFRGKEKADARRPWAARLILPAAAYLAFSSAAERTVFAMQGWKILRYFYNITQTPAAGFFGSVESGRTAHILLGALLLFAAALFLALGEALAFRYILIKDETKQVVSMTALAELYEKKLNQELVMKNYLADKNARLEERENISRNIHNSVGHSMTAAIMALDAAELLLTADTEKAGQKVRAANRRIHAGLDSIRQAVRILDCENNYFPVEDFLSYIKEMADNFMMDTTLQIRIDDIDVLPGLSLPREYSEFLVGAVSELLTNGVRHGNADIFSILLTADSAHIRISVLDNGVSDFSPENAWDKIENGYGLKKMISFAQKCGGSVVFENTYGFKVVVTLPLYPERLT